ncbi:unnamed protein product [Zymoseptoria tritici ST99CH_1A5]|uniref:Reverse transcriptase domain-containing protein n=1 Tax=Zymoseptoria tritici ST99CH_1A5 TaxID=1276529 RepID=A0A1Y6LU82_ZYMTR|nr:unnamed protein product [Zymoseptoria tritici ST99CH_1A5]
MADGSSIAKRVTHCALVEMDIAGHHEQSLMFVADLQYDVVLGLDWFNRHEPYIHWKTGRVAFVSEHRTAYGFKGDIISTQSINHAYQKPLDFHPRHPTPPKVAPLLCPKAEPFQPVVTLMPASVGIERITGGTPTEVRPLSARAIELMAHRPDAEVFACWIQPDPQNPPLTASATTVEDYEKFMAGNSTTKADILAKLPTMHHDQLEAFSRKEADTLSQHQPDVDHEIHLKDGASLPFRKPYRLSGPEEDALKKWVDDMVAKGMIRKSTSEAAAPVIVVRKPGGGLRVCIDYRALNALTVKNRYPIPLVQDTLARLGGKKYFTKLDIIAAFNRIRIAAGHEHKTAFTTRYGQFECLAMPFGLCNVLSTFQSAINHALREYLDDFCSAYLDDVLVFSDTLEEHEQHVRKVIDRLHKAGLPIDIDKSEFHVHETKYLGLIIGREGIRMDPEKVAAVLAWETPTTVKDVQSFLGFANFYRRFVEKFSKVAVPLTALTRMEPLDPNRDPDKKLPPSSTRYLPFEWNDACQRAFDDLKDRFTKALVLAYFTPGLETILETDALDFVTAAVLSQRGKDRTLRPVAYLSKKMSPAKCNYDIYDKELMAIVKAFEEWRPELAADDGELVKVMSDHKNLEHFMSTKVLNRRQARWAEFLSQFNFTISFVSGKSNSKADALTRLPQDLPASPDDPRLQHQHQTILQPKHLAGHTINTSFLLVSSVQAVPLAQEVHELYHSERGKEARAAITDLARGTPNSAFISSLKRQLEDIRTENGMIYVRNAYGSWSVYVPGSDDNDPHTGSLRTRIIQSFHNTPAAGHPGQAKTFELVSRQFY